MEIDEKISYEDATSVIFLAVENLKSAHEFALNVEEKGMNKVWGEYGIMFLLYHS